MLITSALSRLPLSTLYRIASVLAFLAHRVVGYRKKVVKHNIDLCFPELTEKERKAIVKGFYRHFADLFVEAVWFGGSNGERLHRQRIMKVLNPETLKELSADGRSMMVLCSHFGNWELIGGLLNYNYSETALPFAEDNVVVVYKKLNSKTWDNFMQRNRTAPLEASEEFDGYVETHDVLRYVLRHRNEQKFYHFITDQKPYRAAKGRVPVAFLGQECYSMEAAANLALRFNFTITYQRIKSVGRGHYTMEYIPLPSDPEKTNAQEIMNRFYELLTEDIKAQPELYLWSHKRFRLAR